MVPRFTPPGPFGSALESSAPANPARVASVATFSDMPSRRRLALVLLGAFAFGAFAAWAKGPGTDGIETMSQLRADLGNLSTPWLLVACFAGAQCSRPRAGALLGLLASVAALIAFYVVTTPLIDLGGSSFLENLRLELSANRGYFEGGLITGPIFGALGAWWRTTRSYRASILVGALLIGEPLVLAAMGVVHRGVAPEPGGSVPVLFRMFTGWGLSPDSPAISIGVYAAEFALGVAVVLVAALRSPRLRMT
jgi:hypothetical protein